MTQSSVRVGSALRAIADIMSRSSNSIQQLACWLEAREKARSEREREEQMQRYNKVIEESKKRDRESKNLKKLQLFLLADSTV